MADEVVYVVDDDEHVRRGLCRLLVSVGLSAEPFSSTEAFLARPLRDQPSCLVLDLHLGNAPGGLDLLVQLAEHPYTIPSIFMTGARNVRPSVRAMKAGAFDVLEKPVDDEALLASVRDALAFSRRSARAQADRQTVQGRLARLTAREREVLWLVVRGGLTNRQIAAELGVAERTIKVHRGQVTRKMEANSVAALVHMIQRLDVNQPRSSSGDDAAVGGPALAIPQPA
jgi:FixJ family two-component response regulator